ncbi:hypothetical protein [Acetivibrio cellulolyticus]|uniref:hypothetical protein n=1 Tax=Acetivibrio cellulolyticus TaxID=35830 RepID=UPI0001E2C79E|nr:hypothetical protein [Acetivibrio cellulolyticus]
MVKIIISRELAFKLNSSISLDIFISKRLEGFLEGLEFLEEILDKLCITSPNEIIIEIPDIKALKLKKYIEYKIQSLSNTYKQISVIVPEELDDKYRAFATCETEELQRFYEKLCRTTENIN